MSTSAPAVAEALMWGNRTRPFGDASRLPRTSFV